MRRTAAATVGVLLTAAMLVAPGRATADTADIAAWTYRTRERAQPGPGARRRPEAYRHFHRRRPYHNRARPQPVSASLPPRPQGSPPRPGCDSCPGRSTGRWTRSGSNGRWPPPVPTSSPRPPSTSPVHPPGSPGDGSVLADDADYGPMQPDGTRAEGSDFNDYLGKAWSYGPTVDEPEADQAGALDCSGFVRMIFGHRFNIPLALGPDGSRLPRRSTQMLSSAPGVVTIRDTGTRPSSLAKLAPGDLVFFDGSSDDGTLVDHVGIYIGRDNSGAPRFISSRKTANGPTLGDVGGRSTLTGTGHYASTWRAARPSLRRSQGTHRDEAGSEEVRAAVDRAGGQGGAPGRLLDALALRVVRQQGGDHQRHQDEAVPGLEGAVGELDTRSRRSTPARNRRAASRTACGGRTRAGAALRAWSRPTR